jgi:hypothetical protein
LKRFWKNRQKGKTLFLHIGLQKTGTTSIQTFLTQNQSLLADHGFVYPDPHKVRIGLDDINHGHLSMCLTGYWRETGYQLNREEAWGELRDLYFETDGHLLISHEGLSTPQMLPHLPFIRKMLGDLNVKIVLYLRRQDIFVQSVYKERLKADETREFQQAFEQGDYPRLLQFYSILEHWQKCVGRNNVIVRPYESGQLLGGDVLKDFLDVVGAGEIQGLKMIPENENRTMNWNVLEISRVLNSMDISGAEVSDFKWWLNGILSEKEPDTFVDHNIISPTTRQAILKDCQSGNEKIAREFLARADGRLFYDPHPDTAEDWQPHAGIPPGDVAKMLAAIFEKYPILDRKDG